MANPDEKVTSFEFEGKTYRLVLNNAGKREAEKFAGMSMGDMGVQMMRNVLGSTTVLTAILWGGTRKYSSRKILTPDQADALMDRVDRSEDDGTAREVTAALIACFTGEDKEEWIKNLTPDEEPDEDEDPDEGEPDEDDKPEEPESDEAPKAPKKGSGKRSGSRSEAGSGSSKKE